MNEASLNDANQFVTLTYDEDNLPDKGDLNQKDMQKFFKRLRKEFQSKKLRYVYSAEYGGEKSRPHYHTVIFGLALADLIIEDSNNRGEPLYGSKTLDRIWTHGHCIVGKVTHQSCGYVAGYMLKDINGDYDNRNQYETLNIETGEITPRKRPFARYSNRPGIGKKWFDQYWSDCFPHDYVVVNGTKRPVPEYYFKLLKKRDPDMHAEVLEKREKALITPQNRWNSTPDRLTVRETCIKAKISNYKRGSASKDGAKIFVEFGG